MIFAKVAADLDLHPKIRRAGRAGREIFLFVLRRNAGADFNGRVPAGVLHEDYLADVLMMTPEEASHGLSRCVTAGLLELVDDEPSYAVIVGWDDEWAKRPLTDAERKQRQRAKSNGDDALSNSSREVTNASVTKRDSHACHASEKSREEEIREEEKRVPPSAAKRKAPASPLSSDWAPTTEHSLIAAKRGVDISVQVAKFRAHAEANDRRAVRWNAAFTQWLLNSWPERKPPAATGASLVESRLEHIAQLEREEAEAREQA